MKITVSTSIDQKTGKEKLDISCNLLPPKTKRDHKGNSIIAFPDSYCVIDIETTGLSPSWDSIIEISALKVSSNSVIDTFSSLVQPFSTTDHYVNEYITQLTGITNEMLSSAPKEKEVIPKFKNFIGSSVLIGHNVHFDINFLYDSFENHLNIPLENDFIDTMRIARKLHPELPHHRLADIAELYDIDYSSAHRALKDCEITNNCYIQMKKKISNQYESLDLFAKLSGKHYSSSVKAKDIHATTEEFDDTNILYGKVVVFTGTLEKLTRKEAMQIVANLGGINGDGITKRTNYLVVGNNDYCTLIKDGKSNKLKKAEQLKLNGQDIEILPENVFYDMLDSSLLSDSSITAPDNSSIDNDHIMTTEMFEQNEIDTFRHIENILSTSGQDASLLRCRLGSNNILCIINFYPIINFKLRGKKKYFSFPNSIDVSKYDLTIYTYENGRYIIDDSFNLSSLDNIILDVALNTYNSFKYYKNSVSSTTVSKNLKAYLKDNYH